MKLRFNITVGLLFIVAGMLISSDNIIRFIKSSFNKENVNQTQQVQAAISNDNGLENSMPDETSLPTHINISSVGISLDIEPGYFDRNSKEWTSSETKAVFAMITVVPNTKTGNTYIYAHNNLNLFAKLNNANLGDKAEVTNENGNIFTYKLAKIIDVTPEDLSYLDYRGEPILTLQTCSGLWDQYRRLFIFDFESRK